MSGLRNGAGILRTAGRELVAIFIRSCPKKVFWLNLYVGRNSLILEILSVFLELKNRVRLDLEPKDFLRTVSIRI